MMRELTTEEELSVWEGKFERMFGGDAEARARRSRAAAIAEAAVGDPGDFYVVSDTVSSSDVRKGQDDALASPEEL
jgi:hypothetical protein